ncbi:hypothetical protein QBC46DRAFT_407063 [Diplogelasinospora grovesii]|uniref:Uncharacterized protein n=1 Tax=Diplogelasinospora grovesii TaxID=303347 RepID=A0AAN6N9D0_9PEZI|nr:hypothetical protein QBC46DRAFT_407063 [Diplogelasinospora grovesii]
MKTTSVYSLMGLMCAGTRASGVAPIPSASPCSSIDHCISTTPLTPRFFTNYSSQRLQFRYGPFTIPPLDVSNGMVDYNFPIPPPCTDCLITYAQAGMEYPNGSYANANTSTWLHHAVISNLNRTDATCERAHEPVFASGNERSAADICVDGTEKAGYYIAEGDQFWFTAELMNALNAPQNVVVTFDWEYVPSPPSDFMGVIPVWLDVDGGCPAHGSEVPVPANQTAFQLGMDPPWTAPFEGDIVWIGSHLHDGGEALSIFRNMNIMCYSVAVYGEIPGYIDPMPPMNMSGVEGMDGMGMDVVHISSMGACEGGRVEVGDQWSVGAAYNFTAHPGMMEGGKPAPVMGISLMYVATTAKSKPWVLENYE